MITVEMPEDIRKFEAKFMGNFTLRQTVCLAIGAAIVIPVALLVPVDLMYKFVIGALLLIPFMFAGWFKPQGMNFEVYAMRMIYYYVLTPRIRKAKMKNVYRTSYEKVLKAEEKKKLKGMTDAERKKYLKQKNRPEIKRSDKKRFKVYQ